MKEIIVKTQEELNAVPHDFNGYVFIEGGSTYNPLILKIKFKYAYVITRGSAKIVARGNSSVEARENSSVVARGNSSVKAWGNSSVVARENSSVKARGNSSVEAWGNSSVEAWGNSSVEAWENSSVKARGNSSVVAWENSSVVARENSSVVARGNSSVKAWGNSSVVARENSSVEAWENSSVVAWGEAYISAYSAKSIICKGYNIVKLNEGNKDRVSLLMNDTSHLIIIPGFQTTFSCYEKHYPVQHENGIAIMYKSVHKRGDIYHADYDREYIYVIGKTHQHKCNPSLDDSCTEGLHVSHLQWAVDFGQNWSDLAIIECHVPIDKILVSKDCDGKVRTSELTVIRELDKSEYAKYL